LAIALIALAASSATAQEKTRPFVAPYLGYNVDGTEALFGAAVGIPVRVGSTQLLVTPGLEFYPFLDNGSVYTINVDVHYPIYIPESKFRPYVGGGILLNRMSFDAFGTQVTDTNSQLSAIGGADFGLGALRPFAEANLRFINDATLILKAGGKIAFGSK
jgi:hypothetical protein